MGKVHYLRNEKKDSLRCYREALKLDPFYDEVWIELGRVIINDGFAMKTVRYLEQAYRITGDVPGLSYLLSSCYLHSKNIDKAIQYLSRGIDLDKDLFADFAELFPAELMTKKIRKFLEQK